MFDLVDLFFKLKTKIKNNLKDYFLFVLFKR